MSKVVYGANCWECSDFNIENTMGEECEGSTHTFCDRSLKAHDEKIRVEERKKVLDEVSTLIKELDTDTSLCLTECPRADEPVTCTICILDRAIEKMKEQE